MRQHRPHEEWLQLLLIRPLQRRVERLGDAEASGSWIEHRPQVVRHRSPHLVGHQPGARVARPQVDPAPPGIDAQDVLEPKVFAQGALEHAHGESHQGPAAVARLETLDIDLEEVVVGQVYVNDHLPLHRLEQLVLFVVARRGAEDGANVDLVRQFGGQLLLQAGRILKREIPDVDVVARRERELAPVQQLLSCVDQLLRSVREPAAHELHREDPVVVDAEQLGREVLVGWGGSRCRPHRH
mmetsp:Transcript_3169/g.10704  ORF Transcript_3169/g.10704 Transcript_3169/m.10704 type:complete len:241 (+) Transcript_3169:1030-1752(+)